jgi:uncharacterized Fe-S center protein
MPSTVFYGSARQAQLIAKETLPAKLELILEQLHLRDRVKDEVVAVKMHTGNNMGYSTIHPVFVRRVIQAIKDGGGKSFVVDVNWDAEGAEQRGYSSETLGCPVYPSAGVHEKYFYTHERPYKSIQHWKVAGMIQDATFLVNFAHVKGHPSCSFGAAFKNLALGCMVGETRCTMPCTTIPTGSPRNVPIPQRPSSRLWRLALMKPLSRTRNTPGRRTCTWNNATSAGVACAWLRPEV